MQSRYIQPFLTSSGIRHGWDHIALEFLQRVIVDEERKDFGEEAKNQGNHHKHANEFHAARGNEDGNRRLIG